MAAPIVPVDGMEIRADTVLADGVHYLPHGIVIAADGVTLDGRGALLVGAGREGTGVRVEGRHDVTVRGVRLRGYYHGLRARACRGLTLADCDVADTAETPPNTIFLDVWLEAEQSYGGGILLHEVTDSRVVENDLQHQQSGLLTYDCARLSVRRNQANYNSGYGIHLSHTCDSLFEENSADYCCRFEPREGGRHYGHMGADATGFLAVRASCRNVFRRNTARLGGDGFFLAGLAPDGTKCGCDDNLFEENDGSLSPNIAFEATFCRGNVFRGNYADRGNYGFWLGFSWDCLLEDNRMLMNRQAGVAVENGHHMTVRGNALQANGHGILLWSRHNEQFARAYPESLTSHHWTIERNVMTRNVKGIRIAADQDHGIRDLPEDKRGGEAARPSDHVLRGNDIQDNRVGVELVRADRTVLEGNILNRNVEANLRQDDAAGTVARNNLGSAGGYL